MGGTLYSYGPGLTAKEARRVPCFCCGETGKVGRLFAAPEWLPEGIMRLCDKHATLAFRAWPKVHRLHAKNAVGWYKPNPDYKVGS